MGRLGLERGFLEKVAEGLETGVALHTSHRSVLSWVAERNLVNERGESFDFGEDHSFLARIMEDMNPRQAIRKCSQVGVSTSLFLKEAAIAHLYGFSVIHTLPTIALLNFFVAQKVDQVIRNNRAFQGMFDKSYTSKQRKKIGHGWIMFLGTKGENEEISHTSDLNLYDEYDKSDTDTMEGMRSRLKASRYQGIWIVGNPEVADGGVSAAFDRSCQYHWFHRCSRCGHRFYNDFFSCVDMEKETYMCPRCHRPLREEDRRKGEWVARYPKREWSGYWISHMMAPWISARSLVEDYFTMPEEKFYTYCLGIAPPFADSRIPPELILRNCRQPSGERGPAYMGVDVGAKFHCVIGDAKGVYALEVRDNSHDAGWSSLDELMRTHAVRCCVVDKLPSPEEAMGFARRHPGRVWVQVQTRDIRASSSINFLPGPDPVVHIDKNELVSLAIKRLQQGEVSFFLDPTNPLFSGRTTHKMQRDYQSFVGQATTLSKERVEDPGGNIRYRWRASPKKDHFFMAFCYYLAAAERDKKVEEIYEVEKVKPKGKNNPYAVVATVPDAWYYM